MSRKFTYILLLLVGLFSFQSGHASFDEGNKLYLEKKYDEAYAQYENALKSDPENSAILANLGLTDFHRGNAFKAMGYFRKALYFDPQNTTAKAGLKYVSKNAKVPQIPQNLSTFELFDSYFLNIFSLEALFVFSLISFAFCGYLWIRYWGRRKLSIEKEIAPPPTPIVAGVLTLLAVIFTGSFLLKIYDSQFTRGSIIQDKVSLQTAPGEDQVAIMDLYGGFEVKILQTKGDWIQVSYPGNPSGWIKKSSVMMTH